MAALAVSLLAHLALMGEVGLRGLLPLAEPVRVAFPIEAHLQPPPPEPVPPPPKARVAVPRPVPDPVPPAAETSAPGDKVADATPPAVEPPPLTDPTTAPEAEMSSAPPAPSVAPKVGQEGAGPEQTVAEGSPAKPASQAPLPVALRSLPATLTLVYDIRIGDDGFNVGRGTYTWRAEGGRYRLESVAVATGLAALFVGGRATQSSQGRIGPEGLLPEEFRMSRNKRSEDVARFDWQSLRLDLSRGGVPLRPQTQDLLSFPFHLAMTVDEEGEGWILPVTNGRKLKGYRFSVLGRETLDLAGQSVETLHVQGRRALEGTLDVWLAPGRYWLPLRIRTQDQQGKIMLLNLAP